MNAGLGSRLIFFRFRLLVFFCQVAPSPATHFFFLKRLRLRGAKKMRLLAAVLNYLLFVKFGEIFFPPQTTNVKLQDSIYIIYVSSETSGCRLVVD